MEAITLEPYGNGRQAFVARDGVEKLGEMVVAISGKTMTVYHTETLPVAEGRGVGKLLLNAMADHARQQQLTVVPLCVFVQAQFKRHPSLYTTIWNG